VQLESLAQDVEQNGRGKASFLAPEPAKVGAPDGEDRDCLYRLLLGEG